MPIPQAKSRILWLLVALIIIFIPAGCGGASPTGAPDGQGPTDISSLESPVPPTSIPSPTPQVGEVWLITPADADPSLIETVSSRLAELAVQSSYSFQSSESLSESDLTNAKIVVWIGEGSGIESLSATAPQTHFVLIGPTSIEASANLSVINLSPSHTSFVAGLVATLVAPDRRSGGLFSADDPLAAQAQNAFTNGGAYLCGRCVPVYAPVVFFPVTGTVAENLGFDGWKAGFDQLDQNRMEVLYLPQAAVSTEMLDYLQDQSVVVVGNTPPPDGYTSMWVASITFDASSALDQLWSEIIVEGAVGQTINAEIKISSVNDLLLSPGKLQLVQKTATDLQAGWIEPLSVP